LIVIFNYVDVMNPILSSHQEKSKRIYEWHLGFSRRWKFRYSILLMEALGSSETLVNTVYKPRSTFRVSHIVSDAVFMKLNPVPFGQRQGSITGQKGYLLLFIGWKFMI